VSLSLKLNLLKQIELLADNILVTCSGREAAAAPIMRLQVAERIWQLAQTSERKTFCKLLLSKISLVKEENA
jgi:hypothetical protein